MVETKITDRLSFLVKKFDVFESFDDKLKELTDKNFEVTPIYSNSHELLAIISHKIDENDKSIKNISINFKVFSNIIEADPTLNKTFVQWMLNVFNRLLRDENKIIRAIQFVSEDLPQAKTYLNLFEANKRKKKFKDLCLNSYGLKHIVDPTDINQYKSLSQLFDAVDPFIEKNPTELGDLLLKFVEAGQAEIPVRDRKFTLFIPKTLHASEIFDKFVNWCTSKKGNGMFTSYTSNNRRPDGSLSKLYIIINNNFFLGLSNELYQIHFETNQIKDRLNNHNVSIFENVINESENLSAYFYDELINLAKSNKNGLDNNKYLDFLIKFGFCESLFELIDKSTPTIRFMSREIPRLPDISKFKTLDQLIIINAKLVEIHNSIGELENLEMLVLTENRIKSIPKDIGKLKNLTFLNLVGNPILDIPNEIKYLDKSNGGSLFRIAVRVEDIGEKNYKKLKELLPTTKF